MLTTMTTTTITISSITTTTKIPIITRMMIIPTMIRATRIAI